jgi:hypothetical protein
MAGVGWRGKWDPQPLVQTLSRAGAENVLWTLQTTAPGMRGSSNPLGFDIGESIGAHGGAFGVVCMSMATACVTGATTIDGGVMKMKMRKGPRVPAAPGKRPRQRSVPTTTLRAVSCETVNSCANIFWYLASLETASRALP